MAIIMCPECGKEISDQGSHCIHCGYPLKVEEPKVFEHMQEKPKMEISFWGIVSAVVCALIIFSFA